MGVYLGLLLLGYTKALFISGRRNIFERGMCGTGKQAELLILIDDPLASLWGRHLNCTSIILWFFYYRSMRIEYGRRSLVTCIRPHPPSELVQRSVRFLRLPPPGSPFEEHFVNLQASQTIWVIRLSMAGSRWVARIRVGRVKSCKSWIWIQPTRA